MKILYVITKSEYGGAQTHIFQLSKYMKEKGNEVSILAYPEGWLGKMAEALGVRFYPNLYFRNSYNPFLGLMAMAKTRKAVNDFKPDLISCHSTAAGFWGRLAIRGRISTIFTAHGWGFTEGTPFLRKNLVVFTERLVGRYCNKIICVSENDKNLALKYKVAQKEKLIVVHNGVEIGREENKRFEGQNIKSKIKIIFIGRLAEPKDPLLLLAAFNELSKEAKSRAEVLIIGEGEKRKELEGFIEENKLKESVKLLGGLSREKVFEVLKKSDIFVLISKWEGFPRTILEAMSCSLPIIASDVGGVSEAFLQGHSAELSRSLQDKQVGYLIKRGDVGELKKALIELMENPDLRKRMGQNARERVEKEFSLDKMLKKTEEIYRIA